MKTCRIDSFLTVFWCALKAVKAWIEGAYHSGFIKTKTLHFKREIVNNVCSWAFNLVAGCFFCFVYSCALPQTHIRASRVITVLYSSMGMPWMTGSLVFYMLDTSCGPLFAVLSPTPLLLQWRDVFCNVLLITAPLSSPPPADDGVVCTKRAQESHFGMWVITSRKSSGHHDIVPVLHSTWYPFFLSVCSS